MTGRVNPLPGLTGLGAAVLPALVSPLAASTASTLSPSFAFNPSDAAAQISIDQTRRIATRSAAAASYYNVRGTLARASGLYLVSFWIGPTGSAWAAGNTDGVGLSNSTFVLTNPLGGDTNSIRYGMAGAIDINNVTVATYATLALGDRVDIVVDFTHSTAWFRRNEGFWNLSASADPFTNTGGLDISAVTGPLFPTACLRTPSIVCRSVLISPFPVGGATYPWSV